MTDRITRPCASCGAPRGCHWSVDAWVCGPCGDEWYPEHGHPYEAPDGAELNVHDSETRAHEAEHLAERRGGERVDRRVCQSIGCMYGDSEGPS